MSLQDYLPVLVQFLIAGATAVVVLGVSHLFGQRAETNKSKDTAYECGVLPVGPAQTRFSVKFYVVAMLFIIFDIEIVFLIPWALVFRDFLSLGIPVLMPVLFFLGVLVVGLCYELKMGGLEWDE